MRRVIVGTAALLSLLSGAVTTVAHAAPLQLAQAGDDAMVAGDAMMEGEEAAGYASEAIFLGADILNMAFLVVAMLVFALVIGRHGASELSTIFGHFLLGTALLAASRLFLLLADNGVLRMHGDATHMAWHTILYLALFSFILGARGLVHLATSGQSKVSKSELGIWGSIASVLTLALFIFAQQFEVWYLGMTTGSTWESFGGMHFLAFLFAFVTAFYVFQRTRAGEITKVIATPMLVAIGLISVQHFWELLAESWGVVELEEAVIEQVELLFVVPSSLALLFAALKLWKISNRPVA